MFVCTNSNHRGRVQIGVQSYGKQETEIWIANSNQAFGDFLFRTTMTTKALKIGELDRRLEGDPTSHLDGWPAVLLGFLGEIFLPVPIGFLSLYGYALCS